MKKYFFPFKKIFSYLTDLKFALLILFLIAGTSSLGSIIEQDETIEYYQNTYPSVSPLYGFVDWKWITFWGFDHLYQTWWFISLLLLLSVCLISCTLTRQFPLYWNSKEFFFQKQKTSFLKSPFSVSLENRFYTQEVLLTKLQDLGFHIYQRKNGLYGYKGLIGRISPILVHLSLLFVLGGALVGAFQNLKAQEVVAKGEIFHIQNPIQIGPLTSLPTISGRVNDFWVEYEKSRIHQFYSNLSLLDPVGKEMKEQTISVNNPLRYQAVDFYQSDWNLIGIRIEFQGDRLKNRIDPTRKEITKNVVPTLLTDSETVVQEIPLFSLPKSTKSWITWIPQEKNNWTLVFDQFQNVFLVYDAKGQLMRIQNIGEWAKENFRVTEIVSSTGLLIKYDPTIGIIYFGFGLLMITACLSYLPYTQIWLWKEGTQSFLSASTNRGKIQLEIEFENLLRSLENFVFLVSSQRFKKDSEF